MPLTTREAAEEIGTTTNSLHVSILTGRVKRPAQRGPGGCLLWTAEDVAEARLAMGRDRRKREFRRPCRPAANVGG